MCGCRYPFDEAASVAISTVKDYARDIKEVIYFFGQLNISCILNITSAGVCDSKSSLRPKKNKIK